MVYRQYSRFPSFRPYTTAFNVVRKRRPAGSGPSPRGGENMWVQAAHPARAATGDASLGSGAKPDGRPDAG